jgi:copper chaperone
MHDFKLPDMSCGHCVAAITEALRQADPAAQVQINRESRTAQVHSALPRQALAAALAAAGYPPAAD